MEWNRILSEEDACTFVRIYEPRAYGSWFTYEPAEAPDDLMTIEVGAPFWADFMGHVSYKSFGRGREGRQEGSKHIGDSVYIRYSSIIHVVANLRDDDEDGSKKSEIDELEAGWKSDWMGYGFWFKFTCTEDGPDVLAFDD